MSKIPYIVGSIVFIVSLVMTQMGDGTKRDDWGHKQILKNKNIAVDEELRELPVARDALYGPVE